jgi:tripartite ATP-independent transporter DctM subunit
MDSAGVWMLLAVAVLMIGTGLPTWVLLIGVALAFALLGILTGAFSLALMTALPGRVIGLLESDVLQALPLFVLIGALLHHLPLADVLFKTGRQTLGRTGAGASLSGVALGALLAPMNGSAGASVSMLARTVHPQLTQRGLNAERSAALVCAAGTLGVVVPPSLVLILLGDAMLRAHTEAVNATGRAVRIINTQDVFRGALIPAAMLLLLYALIAWQQNRSARDTTSDGASAITRVQWLAAGATVLLIGGLLASVTLGYLYAVEAAATGCVVLCVASALTRTLTLTVAKAVLRDTMAITGALFALLLAATTFTLTLRAFGTDRWMTQLLSAMPGGTVELLTVALLGLALCAFVLDAFEMIFVVVPIVLPPLLMRAPDATWVAVLVLLILQLSFMVPPFGYAVMIVRKQLRPALGSAALMRALWPYVAAQLLVLVCVLARPGLIWHSADFDTPTKTEATPAQPSMNLQDLLGGQSDKK